MMTKVKKKAFEQEIIAVVKKHLNFDNMTEFDAKWQVTPVSEFDFKKLDLTVSLHFELLADENGKFEARGIKEDEQ